MAIVVHCDACRTDYRDGAIKRLPRDMSPRYVRHDGAVGVMARCICSESAKLWVPYASDVVIVTMRGTWSSADELVRPVSATAKRMTAEFVAGSGRGVVFDIGDGIGDAFSRGGSTRYRISRDEMNRALAMLARGARAKGRG